MNHISRDSGLSCWKKLCGVFLVRHTKRDLGTGLYTGKQNWSWFYICIYYVMSDPMNVISPIRSKVGTKYAKNDRLQDTIKTFERSSCKMKQLCRTKY